MLHQSLQFIAAGGISIILLSLIVSIEATHGHHGHSSSSGTHERQRYTGDEEKTLYFYSEHTERSFIEQLESYQMALDPTGEFKKVSFRSQIPNEPDYRKEIKFQEQFLTDVLIEFFHC